MNIGGIGRTTTPLKRKGDEKSKDNDEITANSPNNQVKIINRNKDTTEDENEVEMEQSNSTNQDPAVLILNLNQSYIDNIRKLKQDIINEFENVKIKQIKVTAAKNLILIFENEDSSMMILNSNKLFKEKRKIELDNNKERKEKKVQFEIIIKGLSYPMAIEYKQELKQIGIVNVLKFNQKEDYKITKAICETMEKIIKEGIFLDYVKYRVEKYIQQIKPIQCFNCQKFGHFSSVCENKSPTCVKCGGKHKVTDCKSEQIKCANCNGRHTSSYGGCKIYQKHQKEKIETLIKKTDMSCIGAQYSQVVRTNSTQIDLNTVNESIKQLHSGMQALAESINANVKDQLRDFEKNQEIKLNNKIHEFCKRQDSLIKNEMQDIISKYKEELKNNITHKLQAVNNQFHDYKCRMIYVQLDSLKLINPNLTPSLEQLHFIHQSFQTHTNVEISFQNIQSYVQNLFNVTY